MKSVFPDWGNIPCDVLCCIASKTHPSVQDFVRMGAVCRSWQNSLKHLKPKFPICLMLTETSEDDNDNRRCFVTASEEKVMEFGLSEIRNRRCWGTPFGWIATYGLDDQIGLFNPLTKDYLSLPPAGHNLKTDDSQSGLDFIYKVFLSSTPTSPDCIVMVIYSETNKLAFAKPGDQQWTSIESPEYISDVTYFNRQFFVVKFTGDLLICQGLEGSSPKAIEFASRPTQLNPLNPKYIVDLGGHLCMISRYIREYEYCNEDGELEIESLYQTDQFKMAKLDMHTRNWEIVLSLGDRSLFLGTCCTFSVLAADYLACTSNCIYFTEERSDLYNEIYGGGFDTGIFCCDNKEILRLPDGDDELYLSKITPPLWIHPTNSH
ncbi:hypothetical protein CCACVL1_24009 [Corchorus capsularis]|uniref:KIB1-4 beta-propeller domain-containing protein n=1 Tax=Corchorus capsularis TaxID=210143 RepID=A0A1R3GR79_COCAP|nr:hypothetical protein CCACVL1_24009 [Corchorus capsularis]